MTTETAYTTYKRYVTKIVASRVTDKSIVEDVVQAVWLTCHRSTIPDDPTEAKRIVRTITLRTVVEHDRKTHGRKGQKDRLNSGIVTGDSAEFILDQSRSPDADADWSAGYPEHLRYLALHFGTGGTVRGLCDVYPRRKVYADIENLREFCTQ